MSTETPAYGGGKSLKSESVKDIEKGDSSNSLCWSFSNHLGTHIDFPSHFVNEGHTVSDYHPDFWIFQHPFLVDLSPVGPGTIISTENCNYNRIPVETDLILIKTGFCNLRNKAVYWKNNPGVSPELAFVLRENFSKLRMIGFDSISTSSYTHRKIGREAHRAFLNHNRPILLLEDMDLSKIDQKTVFDHIIVAPLRVENSDAAPCTVLAEINE